MATAVCLLGMVPMRKEASDRSEMVSQILFGEFLRVEEEMGNWLRIVTLMDDYEGWIDYRQCVLVSDQHTAKEELLIQPICYEHASEVKYIHDRPSVKICLGASLPGLQGNKLIIGESEFLFDGSSLCRAHSTRADICETALLYLGSPYFWGGRSPFGIDCSGLTQMVFRINNIALPRDAAPQSSRGSAVAFAGQAEAGDLAFFENEEGEIVHTGIVLPGQKIIHASGYVRIDSLDHEGIYNEELKHYTHKLRLIKSMFDR